ncbi:MAG: VOC family protein [Desulfobacter sp.]
MNRYGLSFHHLGLAVSKPDFAEKFLQGIGYKIGERVYDPLQNVYLKMCDGSNHPPVELIFASETAGPLDGILKNHTEMIYHICYTTNNISESLQNISNDNIRTICISAPKPAVLFSGLQVAFYYVNGFGTVELIERAK